MAVPSVVRRLMIFIIGLVSLVGISKLLLHQPLLADGNSSYNVAVPHDAPIPANALRLRIIANSNSQQDQSIKLKVRNAIVVAVSGLVKHAQNAQQAKAIVKAHVPELQRIAATVLRDHGFTYHAVTEVARVPFPTKIYGNQVYPAGEYEALRIVLGKGQGANWWCVLFPPLCFVDIAEGAAVPNTGGFPDLPPIETVTIKGLDGKPTKVQVRLASVDYGEELWHKLQQYFN